MDVDLYLKELIAERDRQPPTASGYRRRAHLDKKIVNARIAQKKGQTP